MMQRAVCFAPCCDSYFSANLGHASLEVTLGTYIQIDVHRMALFVEEKAQSGRCPGFPSSHPPPLAFKGMNASLKGEMLHLIAAVSVWTCTRWDCLESTYLGSQQPGLASFQMSRTAPAAVIMGCLWRTWWMVVLHAFPSYVFMFFITQLCYDMKKYAIEWLQMKLMGLL